MGKMDTQYNGAQVTNPASRWARIHFWIIEIITLIGFFLLLRLCGLPDAVSVIIAVTIYTFFYFSE